MAKRSNTARYWYVADRQRIAFHDQADDTLTHYVGGLYEKEVKLTGGGAYLDRYYIMTPSGRAATRVVTGSSYTTGASVKMRYLHQDSLGSVWAVTDNSGDSVASYSYDAWGQRPDNFVPSAEDDLVARGYTDHEMLDDYGVIHMNGRVYDPKVSRFLSADPFIDSTTDSQSYNRYSYVNNNPLKYSDPSGYFKFKDILPVVIGIVVAAVTIASGGTAGGSSPTSPPGSPT